MKPRATMRTALVLALAPSFLLLLSVCVCAQKGVRAGQVLPGSATAGASEPQLPPAPPASPPAQGTEVQSKPKGQAESEPASSPRPKARRKHRAPQRQQPASGKVVVDNGGARERDTELTPDMSQEQARRQREYTTQLMARTDSNLKQAAGRELTPAEQSMVEQIRTYMRQAKAAEESGDVTRAHTLAYKAQLLSSELAHR